MVLGQQYKLPEVKGNNDTPEQTIPVWVHSWPSLIKSIGCSTLVASQSMQDLL